MAFNAKEFSNDDERSEEAILNFTKPVEHRGWRGRVSIHYKTKPHKFGVFVLLPVFCLTKMLSPEEERRQILNSGAFAVGGKLSNVKSRNVDGVGPQFAKKLLCCPRGFLDPSLDIPLHVKNIMQLRDRTQTFSVFNIQYVARMSGRV